MDSGGSRILIAVQGRSYLPRTFIRLIAMAQTEPYLRSRMLIAHHEVIHSSCLHSHPSRLPAEFPLYNDVRAEH